MGSAKQLPRHVDVAVLGGGSAGCVVASRLTEILGLQCRVVEAGPDYGPYEGGRWPTDILDAGADALVSHDWGFTGGVASARARILGGCSAINGAGIVWPAHDDLDAWWPDAGWSYETLEPYLKRAAARMRARLSAPSDLEPWRRAFLDAASELGLAGGHPFNGPASPFGAGMIDVNTVGRVRWNTAFAYIDPARERSSLTTTPDTLVDRLVIKRGRAISARVIHGGIPSDLAADSFILAAGSFGTPAILMRSGIGDPPSLRRVGISPVVDLPGVGSALWDHPLVDLPFEPREHLRRSTDKFLSAQPAAAQVLLRASACHDGRSAWDLTLGPWLGPKYAGITVMLTKPDTVGKVTIASESAFTPPQINHGFRTLSDRDVNMLAEGVALGFDLAGTRSCGALASADTNLGSATDLHEWIRAAAVANHHPVGTCKMGPSGDPLSVIDEVGRVHGLDNVFVVDASIMPSIPRANVHLTVLAAAERLAESYKRRLSNTEIPGGV